MNAHSETLTMLDNPADVLERYEAALAGDHLKQGNWRDTAEDGRWLACALGVIGEEVNDPSDCPASIMPRWLAQMVPAFFDNQKEAEAKEWGLAFYKALARINGEVPFRVIHDWHASTVCALAIEVAEKRGVDPAPHKKLQALHAAARDEAKISADEWRPVLKDAYANAYAYAYAKVNADANAYANADADAYANANAYADAYANADANAWTRLANGMVEALNRVEVSA